MAENFKAASSFDSVHVHYKYRIPPKTEEEILGENAEDKTAARKQSRVGEIWKRLLKNHSAVAGLCIILFFVVIGFIGPLIAPYDYQQVDIVNSFLLPCKEHWFGTDQYGRDIFSRILCGTRYSLLLGLCGQLFGVVFGIIVGSISGYFSGWVDNLIMRLLDIIQAIPAILLSIIISMTLGGGFFSTVLAMGVGGIAGSARVIRAQFLQVREMDFVEAEKSIDCSTPKIIFSHILPNAISPLIVQTTMGIGATIMGAAGLSYLGLGIRPPIPEWGAMLSDAKAYIMTEPQLMIYPGVCIAIFVLALNMFGDGLRDALDPKLKD